MRKIRKLINSIALLMAPSVVFPAITRDQFINFISREGMRDERNVFIAEAIADAGVVLINEGANSEDELVKNLRKYFIDILESTSFANKKLRTGFFENLGYLGSGGIDSKFINQIEDWYWEEALFIELKGRLLSILKWFK